MVRVVVAMGPIIAGTLISRATMTDRRELVEAPTPTVGRALVATTTDRLAMWARAAARRRVANLLHMWPPIAHRVLVVRTTAQTLVVSRRHISLAGTTGRRELAALRFAVARVVVSPTSLLLAMSGLRSPMLAGAP